MKESVLLLGLQDDPHWEHRQVMALMESFSDIWVLVQKPHSCSGFLPEHKPLLKLSAVCGPMDLPARTGKGLGQQEKR